MTKQKEIREWAKGFLESTAHNGFYDGLEIRMLEELHAQGIVIKLEQLSPPAGVEVEIHYVATIPLIEG